MICPFMSFRNMIERACRKEECALWDEENQCCAIKSLLLPKEDPIKRLVKNAVKKD